MPVNAPPEYYKAEEKFRSAKTQEEKIAALEEMIRLLPKHKGSEHLLGQLRAKMSKLKKEKSGKKSRSIGIKKEGDGQVCILGVSNSGKSTLLRAITNAKPKISKHPYTTTEPAVGMMDYKGIKIQIIEIPSFFTPKDMAIVRTADLAVILSTSLEDKRFVEKKLEENFIRIKSISIKPTEDAENIKKKIWSALGLMIVYPKKTKTPMALKKGSTIRDFAMRIHKDF